MRRGFLDGGTKATAWRWESASYHYLCHFSATLSPRFSHNDNTMFATFSPHFHHSECHQVNTMSPPCLPHSVLDATQELPVPSDVCTFFVLSWNSTKNVAAGSDFVRNLARWLWGQHKGECVQPARSESDLRPYAEMPPSRDGAAHNSFGDCGARGHRTRYPRVAIMRKRAGTH